MIGRWGGEVGKGEAARSQRVSAGSRGTETETRRTAPAHAGAVLYDAYVAPVLALSCRASLGAVSARCRVPRCRRLLLLPQPSLALRVQRLLLLEKLAGSRPCPPPCTGP